MPHLMTQYDIHSCQVSIPGLIKREYKERMEEELERYFDYLKNKVSYEAYLRDKEAMENDPFAEMAIRGQILAQITQDLLDEKEILIPGVNCLRDFPPHMTILNRN
jgi:hypothetical protein